MPTQFLKFRIFFASLVILIAMIPFSSWGQAVDFVGKESDLERFLKKNEGWSAKDLRKKKIFLSESKSTEDLDVVSSLECGTRTCTHYLFEKMPHSKYRLIGKLEGVLTVAEEIHQDHYDLKTVTSLGGNPDENVETVYQFQGQRYSVKASPK